LPSSAQQVPAAGPADEQITPFGRGSDGQSHDHVAAQIGGYLKSFLDNAW